MTILKSFPLVAFPAHAVLLNFGKEYTKRLIKRGHSPESFLPIETERVNVRKRQILGGLENQYMVIPRPRN